MTFIRQSIDDGIAELRLERGKVNALTLQAVEELAAAFRDLATDARRSRPRCSPGAASSSPSASTSRSSSAISKRSVHQTTLTKFTGLYRQLFVWPKPLVAALNGHTIAGGCMLALACDTPPDGAEGSSKISLNEITFGGVGLLRRGGSSAEATRPAPGTRRPCSSAARCTSPGRRRASGWSTREWSRRRARRGGAGGGARRWRRAKAPAAFGKHQAPAARPERRGDGSRTSARVHPGVRRHLVLARHATPS